MKFHLPERGAGRLANARHLATRLRRGAATTLRTPSYLRQLVVSSLAGALLFSGAFFAVPAITQIASAAPTPVCPAVGVDIVGTGTVNGHSINAPQGCGEIITINADGSVSTQENIQGPIDGSDDVLVGVINNSSSPVTSLDLSGDGIFGFDGDGLCSGTYYNAHTDSPSSLGYCASIHDFTNDPQDYQGPINTFTVERHSTDAGSVDFNNSGLAAGGTTFFSLEQSGSDNFTVTYPSNLSIAKTLVAPVVNGTSELEYGTQATYDLTVSNAGDKTTDTTTVVDTLPSGENFVSGGGAGSNFACVASTYNTKVTCTSSTVISQGSPVVIPITVSLPQSTRVNSSLTNTASVDDGSDATLTNVVQPAIVNVTASSGSMAYGGTVPKISAAYSGFLFGQTTPATPATCTTTATNTSSVGSYPSQCSGAEDLNYTFTYTNGSVHVGQTALVVSAGSGSMTYGGSTPTLSPSTTGLVSPDTLASLGISCASPVTVSSAAGSYTSTCSGPASTKNYTITYNSGSVVVNKAVVVVTAGSGSMTYGGSTPTLTPTSSGLVSPDTLTSLGITCASSVTASSAAGSYASTCSGPASTSNYTISYHDGAVVVGQSALVVTAGSGSMTYGGSTPTLTATTTGLVSPDTLASLGITCASPVTASSAAGSYTSTCSGPASTTNYAITYHSGSVLVSKATLVVTAGSGTMTYGGSTPTLSPSTTGLVSPDTLASLGITCTSPVTASSAAGSYTSTCSGPASTTNYAITYNSGSVGVGHALLVATASSPSMTYGGSAPAITANFSGFVNGDGSSVVSGVSCFTSVSSSSNVGSYPTLCNEASAANYTISYVPGTITVNAAPLTVTASSPSVVYGSSVPPITASYIGFENGQSSSVLTTQAACITSATTSSAVGSYGTSCSGATGSNYVISYVPGSEKVTAAATITVAASSATFTTGTVPPVVTFTVSGLVNGDSSNSFKTQPTCITTATASSGTGSYVTSCSGAVDANYSSIAYVTGSDTVTAAPAVAATSTVTAATVATPTTEVASATAATSATKQVKTNAKPTVEAAAQTVVPAATSVHTGEPWAGSAPFALALGALGILMLGYGEMLRRRRMDA